MSALDPLRHCIFADNIISSLALRQKKSARKNKEKEKKVGV